MEINLILNDSGGRGDGQDKEIRNGRTNDISRQYLISRVNRVSGELTKLEVKGSVTLISCNPDTK